MRHDAELIAELVPELRRSGAALALEMLPASMQESIDRLVNAPVWEPELANAVLRAAAWPYRQYRDVLHAAWAANRSATDRYQTA